MIYAACYLSPDGGHVDWSPLTHYTLCITTRTQVQRLKTIKQGGSYHMVKLNSILCNFIPVYRAYCAIMTIETLLIRPRVPGPDVT